MQLSESSKLQSGQMGRKPGKTPPINSALPTKPSNVRFAAQRPNNRPHKSFWQEMGATLGKIWELLTTPFRWIQKFFKSFDTRTQPPVGKSLNEDWPIGYLSTEQVFGQHPEQITFRQRGGNTCYLLSALDNIFQHPQCKKILDKIVFAKTADGYTVNFPSQEQPIHIGRNEILWNGVESDNPGVRLLETAYLKIPDPEIEWGEYDNTHKALVRIFGNDHVLTAAEASLEHHPIEESFQLKNLLNTQADIWTATRKIKNTRGKTTGTGQHYYSIRSNADNPNSVHVVDPFNTSRVVETLTFPALKKKYHLEMTRINLEDAR